MNNDKQLYVGVVGFSEPYFDENKASLLLEDILDDILDDYINNGEYDNITIVSGLADMGITSIAYQIANDRGYSTIGVAPEEVKDYEQYDVDEVFYVGEEFGDESEEFVSMIDIIVRIGSSEKSLNEIELAEEKDISVIECDL